MTSNIAPLLAFGFASPWLLGGLALGGIPIIIHLLYKRRYRETPWAAMRFLMEAARKHSRRIRLEQLILLCLRVMILVLLVLALAQPYVETFGSYFQADVPAHRVLVLDASFSMGHRQNDRSRFERARSIARRIVSAGRQGDAVNLVRVADSEPRAVVREAAYEKNEVLGEIDQLQVSEEPGDLAAGLETAQSLLRDGPDVRQREVYLISDFQWHMWLPESEGERARLRRLLKDLSDRARLVLIDLGESETANTAVTAFSAAEPFAAVDRPVRLQATVSHFGPNAQAGKQVELYVDERLVQTQRVDLPAGGETTVDFVHIFRSGGEHSLEVRLAGDSLAVDDRRRLALPVREQLNVLLVNGQPAGRARDNATYYLRTALSPSTRRERSSGLIRPEVIKEGNLTFTDLNRYDAVFLCNVGLFTEREAKVLESYVRSGGGLVFCLGDQIRPENYNRVLYRGGNGILPAELGDPVRSEGTSEDVFGFDPDDLRHPIVRPFEGNPGTGLEAATVLNYSRTGVPEESRSEVVLRYSSGDPAIWETPVGRGRSVLVTTSVDASWAAWPIQPSFPPIMHEIVRFSIAGRWTERQRLVGEALVRALPVEALGVPVTIQRPDGAEDSARPAEVDSFARLSYEGTDRSGLYEVELGPPVNRSELFAVNVDPRESDLSRAAPDRLRSSLLAEINYTYRTRWEELRRETAPSTTRRGGLTVWLLAAALALLFVEQLMAWQFLYGMLLLCGLAAAALAWQIGHWSLWAGGLVLPVFFGAVCLVLLLRRRSSGDWGEFPRRGSRRHS